MNANVVKGVLSLISFYFPLLIFRSPKILLGLTGSVATIKAAVIIDEIKSKIENAEIIVILTEHATHFLPENFSTLDVKIYRDQDEWDSWKKRGDPVLREFDFIYYRICLLFKIIH